MSLVAALGMFALAMSALAAPDMPDGKWWKRPRIAAEIGLTLEQRREIESIFIGARNRLIDLKAELEKKQLALKHVMEEGDTDRKAVENSIEEVEGARSELQKARALMLLDMRRVLKPEQWERLLELNEQVRERRRGAGQRRFRGQDRLEDRPRRSDRR